MGIRVHKCIGYGIDGLKSRKYEIADPRIDKVAFDELHNKAYDMKIADVLEWAKKERESISKFHNRLNPHKNVPKDDQGDFWLMDQLMGSLIRNNPKDASTPLSDSVVWDGEYGIAKVMLFIPLGMKWSRYDDTIDHYEETELRRQRRWYRFLHTGGIFPWFGYVRMRDPRPGVLKRGVNKDDFVRIENALHSQLVGAWDPKVPPLAKGEALRHFREDYRPVLPFELSCVLWYYRKAFRDLDAFANSLRPMIYVYWS